MAIETTMERHKLIKITASRANPQWNPNRWDVPKLDYIIEEYYEIGDVHLKSSIKKLRDEGWRVNVTTWIPKKDKS